VAVTAGYLRRTAETGARPWLAPTSLARPVRVTSMPAAGRLPASGEAAAAAAARPPPARGAERSSDGDPAGPGRVEPPAVRATPPSSVGVSPATVEARTPPAAGQGSRSPSAGRSARDQLDEPRAGQPGSSAPSRAGQPGSSAPSRAGQPGSSAPSHAGQPGSSAPSPARQESPPPDGARQQAHGASAVAGERGDPRAAERFSTGPSRQPGLAGEGRAGGAAPPNASGGDHLSEPGEAIAPAARPGRKPLQRPGRPAVATKAAREQSAGTAADARAAGGNAAITVEAARPADTPAPSPPTPQRPAVLPAPAAARDDRGRREPPSAAGARSAPSAAARASRSLPAPRRRRPTVREAAGRPDGTDADAQEAGPPVTMAEAEATGRAGASDAPPGHTAAAATREDDGPASWGHPRSSRHSDAVGPPGAPPDVPQPGLHGRFRSPAPPSPVGVATAVLPTTRSGSKPTTAGARTRATNAGGGGRSLAIGRLEVVVVNAPQPATRRSRPAAPPSPAPESIRMSRFRLLP
jgi:hypothetical protein